jgi:hypothetical protein
VIANYRIHAIYCACLAEYPASPYIHNLKVSRDDDTDTCPKICVEFDSYIGDRMPDYKPDYDNAIRGGRA